MIEQFPPPAAAYRVSRVVPAVMRRNDSGADGAGRPPEAGSRAGKPQ
jgi:hypothetical protein